MLPLQMAHEVMAATREYISATFRLSDDASRWRFMDFLAPEARTSLTRGPYVRLLMPFATADDTPIPLEIQPPFRPHRHQQEAFRRLTMRDDHRPQPTLLTTGTGSGKTECFLYPILDYVYQARQRGLKRGVKAIIMYPMNALATDQAGRLAKIIYDDPRLKDNITVGLFIGLGKGDASQSAKMTADHVIEDRQSIIATAPDILLTNFKMLDYALLRQEFRQLWSDNIGAPQQMLRFLVLDELHTYDGAQGTDVANLVRRLKLKLGMSAHGALVPVGTSATLGTGADAKENLCRYASDIFGEEFTEQSVIGETRQQPEEFFTDEVEVRPIPSAKTLSVLEKKEHGDADIYRQACQRAWLGTSGLTPRQVGERLMRLASVRRLAAVCGGGFLTVEDIIDKMAEGDTEWKALQVQHPDCAPQAVASLLALVAEARTEQGQPLLPMQVTLWMRELSGIQRVVCGDAPTFRWRNEPAREGVISLPIWFCRECGAHGWVTCEKHRGTRYEINPTRIGTDFMRKEACVRLLTEADEGHEPHPDYAPSGVNAASQKIFLRTADLTEAGSEGPGIIQLRANYRLTGNQGGTVAERFDRICPHCMGHELAIIGQKMSTLSSVGVSAVMASEMNEPGAPKMLTFTNSVQDSAHLAAFYEHRTYRFLLRQSIHEYLTRGPKAGQVQTLSEVQEGFVAYWKQKLDGDEYYYRFLPDDIAQNNDMDTKWRKNGKLLPKFCEDFDVRLAYEISTEYGFMSNIGRTLEKSGSSGVTFPTKIIEAVSEEMKPWMEQNEIGKAWEAEAMRQFIVGVMHRLRRRGAVDHPFLEMYRKTLNRKTLNWTKERYMRHPLYRSYSKVRSPRIVMASSVPSGTEVDNTYRPGPKIAQNWFHRYFEKALWEPVSPVLSAEIRVINDFYAELFAAMSRHGLLSEVIDDKGGKNYAISPDAMLVSAGAVARKCSVCGGLLHTAADDTVSEGCACLDFKCEGKYDQGQSTQQDYYKHIYASTSSPRLRAHEHTGLLERAEREKIETSFRDTAGPDALNLLTATSTLEMGINIGDLNVIANAGVPPTVAGYQQRAGRGGRKTGAGLVLNYAGAGAHNDFFFADPEAMMNGDVQSPGCFLHAPDILRRHFYAFCIDTWTTADPANRIPRILELVSADINQVKDPKFFINRISDFVDRNLDEMIKAFRSQYPEATADVMDGLEREVRNGLLWGRVQDAFRRLSARRRELQQKIHTLASNKNATDEMKERLRSLRRLRHTIRETMVLEFMTDSGLLPNYGFPETGIKLTASITDIDAEGNRTKPEIIEAMRSASQGLRDFAPGNHFYTRKMAMEVRGLDVNTDDLTEMRFCENCDATALPGDPEYDAPECPKCGSKSWVADPRKVLRFTGAETYMRRERAAIADREERENERYETERHFRFPEPQNVVSHIIPSIGFGIEFCPTVTITELNYGEKIPTSSYKIDRHAVSEHGFITCKYCHGSSMVKGDIVEAEHIHFPYCDHRDEDFDATMPATQKDTFDRLYLYREMSSEALKILLPVHSIDDVQYQVYEAAIRLGLRCYYNSDPAHLAVCGYREFSKARGDFDNYMVIYDTIPGGTGYLKELSRPENFSHLLELAYTHLRNCRCQFEGKSACYSCLLSYANQFKNAPLTRQDAELTLAPIAERLCEWEKRSTHLSEACPGGPDIASALETLFEKCMESISKRHDIKIEWHHVGDDPKKQFALSVGTPGNDNDVAVYDVIAQYELGPSRHVAENTTPDYYFIPRRVVKDGEELDVAEMPRIALFLDGYAYHADGDHQRFYSDVRRREAIRDADAAFPMFSWTLTWHDIDAMLKDEEKDDTNDAPRPNKTLSKDYSTGLTPWQSPFEEFLQLLSTPMLPTWRSEIFGRIILFSMLNHDGKASGEKVDLAIYADAPDQYNASATREEGVKRNIYLLSDFIKFSSLVNGTAWVNPWLAMNKEGTERDEALQRAIHYDFLLTPELDTIPKDDWRAFWHDYNLLQFFTQAQTPPETEQTPAEPSLDDLKKQYEGQEDIIQGLDRAGLRPDPDYEFPLMNGEDVSGSLIKVRDSDIVLLDTMADADLIPYLTDLGLQPTDFSRYNNTK